MPGGHPTDYNKAMQKKANEYLSTCKDTKDTVNLPKAEGLALHLGISRKTLYNWADQHEEFLHTLEELNQEQVKRLIDNGLAGKYNSNIAKLVLAKHGYKEQIGLGGEEMGEAIKLDVDLTSTIDKVYGKSD